MTDSNTDTHNTTTRDGEPESQRFAERLAEHYRPAPLGSAQRASFDANLRDRVAQSRLPFFRAPAAFRTSATFWAPALATAVAAIVLAGWMGMWPTTSAVRPQPALEAPLAIVATDLNWEADVLSVDADSKVAEEDYLPDDYMAIAFVFIDEM